MKKCRFLFALTFLIFSSSLIFAADTTSSTSYDDISFPLWTKDLRRTEIITFGSLPFVTIWTTAAYSLAVKGTFHNPLDKSTSGFTEEDQKKIITIAGGTSLCLGLADLAINLIARSVKKSKQKKAFQPIQVIPLSQLDKEEPPGNPPLLEKEDNEVFQERETQAEQEKENMKEYFIGGMENALF